MQRQQTKTVKKLHSIEELLQPRSSESKFSAAELKSDMETQLEVDARNIALGLSPWPSGSHDEHHEVAPRPQRRPEDLA